MELVTQDEFRKFISERKFVTIENVKVEIGKPWHITSFAPPKDYVNEEFTVWSFPSRGDWATHSGKYRGNWSPYIPRNLILKYSSPGETVLDQMCGSGTTIVECKLLNRNGIGVDVNRDAIMLTLDRLRFDYNPLDSTSHSSIRTYVGDARNLDRIDDNSIDLVTTHPPYAWIIPYSKKRLSGDLSGLRKLPEFLKAMRTVAAESYRVLKPSRYCAILIGDTRKGRHYIPISIGVLQAFLSVGFILKEDIIKMQHKTMATREKWRGHKYDFYKIAHEHLYVFRKPEKDENTSPLNYSKAWWAIPP
ncbi:MAG TPA: DNA methyltransferase [Candidatus Bathyarchaeia archaeon]|nr:DNA methyltransferase [Candidatus Bathyarchaeia archaeon]